MIQLWTWPTPNGQKIHIALEELGLPYEIVPVNIGKGEQFNPEFLAITPNHRIPAIVDTDGPGGKLPLFESGAILIYLAEKTGQLMPADPAGRYQTLQWVMFQMAGIGPLFGQLGFFHKFAGKDYEDKRPRDRYVAESKRLLAVLDDRLADRPWIVGDDFTIADLATFPWVRNLTGYYGARELVGFDAYRHVVRAFEAFLARPAVIRGLAIPKAPERP